MLHLTISLRALIFVLLFGVALFTGSDVASGAPSANDQFTDVPTGAFYHDPATWAKNNGITAGCGGTNFCPDSTVTRGQMATFLRAALGTGTGTTWALAKSGGNVGIGTETPQVRLHVKDGWGRLQLESTRNDLWTTVNYLTPTHEWHAGVGGNTVINDLKNKYYIHDHTLGVERLVIDTVGNVGIGTNNPSNKLDVIGGISGSGLALSGTALLKRVGIHNTNPSAPLHIVGESTNTSQASIHVTNASNQRAFAVEDQGHVAVGALNPSPNSVHVCHGNQGYLVSCSAAASAFVPTFDSGLGLPQAGHLVSIATGLTNPTDDGHAPFVALKSASSCDPNLVGIISAPDKGADGTKVTDDYLPLATSGFIPVSVSMEGGAIRRGDPITSSSTPGAGMKATGACKTIGYALEDADEDGTLQVFANLGESTAGEVTALKAEVASLKEQNASLEARLTAIEQVLNGGTVPLVAAR